MKGKIKKFITKLNTVIDLARNTSNQPDSYAFLPEIIDILEFMKQKIDSDRNEKKKIIGGIGRIVTDSYTFPESDLGKKILDVINDFREL